MAEATDWAESGDAGDQIATAQTTAGAGSLSHITGAISIFPDHVDIYCVNVPDPQGFYAIIDCTVNADPDLWLFDQDGYGIAHEDVCSGGVVGDTSLEWGTLKSLYR